MHCRLILLTILSTLVAGNTLSQGVSFVPFAGIQVGYGSFLGYTEASQSQQVSGSFLDQPTYRIFGGPDYSVSLGGSLVKDGNDLYKESFFDFYLAHKRLSASSNAAGFTGLGARLRYRFFYGGIMLGLAGNRNELPIDLDDNNIAQTYGDLHGPVPMFALGLRAPLNADHTLYLHLPFDFVIPRNRPADIPEGDAALFEWYSLGIGVCYHVIFK